MLSTTPKYFQDIRRWVNTMCEADLSLLDITTDFKFASYPRISFLET